jgi:hypothetical protein
VPSLRQDHEGHRGRRDHAAAGQDDRAHPVEALPQVVRRVQQVGGEEGDRCDQQPVASPPLFPLV